MLQIKEFSEAAGLGFEPRLTGPESVSTLSWLFTAVQKTAFSSQISGIGVSRCSPLFTPVTVKSLSNCPPTRDSHGREGSLAVQGVPLTYTPVFGRRCIHSYAYPYRGYAFQAHEEL